MIAVTAIVLAVILIQTGVESEAISYLSDDPKACVNCHNMRAAYNSWQHSSHGRDTTCNSCHVPHDSIIKKYYFKGMDGLRHATMFTLELGPQNPILNEGAVEVVQANCVRCHSKTLGALNHQNTEQRPCWECHPSVPHGKLRSISSSIERSQ